MKFGDLIRDRRKSLGLSLEQVGNYCGVGKSTVRKWETGDIKAMRRDKIGLLADILQIPPYYLIYEDGSTAQPVTVSLSDTEYELIALFRAADSRAKSDAMDVLRSHPMEK